MELTVDQKKAMVAMMSGNNVFLQNPVLTDSRVEPEVENHSIPNWAMIRNQLLIDEHMGELMRQYDT